MILTHQRTIAAWPADDGTHFTHCFALEGDEVLRPANAELILVSVGAELFQPGHRYALQLVDLDTPRFEAGAEVVDGDACAPLSDAERAGWDELAAELDKGTPLRDAWARAGVVLSIAAGLYQMVDMLVNREQQPAAG